jgi:hypothetical protein
MIDSLLILVVVQIELRLIAFGINASTLVIVELCCKSSNTEDVDWRLWGK